MIVVRGHAESSRFGVLETLRAYGRERLRENGTEDFYAVRHAAHFTALAERAAAGMHGADERVWVEKMLPDYDNLRAGFERSMADHDVDLALRLVTSLARLADGRVPGHGTARDAYPSDVLADVALYEGDAAAALRHYDNEVKRARHEDDPIRLVWTLFYVAICHTALRTPEAGVPAAEEARQVAETTANPTARSMANYALGVVLKKSEPERALSLFDEAAELAASVHNFWWHGIALMEAAATRAVHGDSSTAASDFIMVLNHWERVGDWSQQWLNLRYVTRLMMRLGADDDALALHHALVNAGRPSPLSAKQVAKLGEDGHTALTGADAVARARSALSRYG